MKGIAIVAAAAEDMFSAIVSLLIITGKAAGNGEQTLIYSAAYSLSQMNLSINVP